MLDVSESIQQSVYRILQKSGLKLKDIDLTNLLVDFNRTMGGSLKGANEDTIGISFIAFSMGHLNIMSPGSAYNLNFGGRLTEKGEAVK